MALVLQLNIARRPEKHTGLDGGLADYTYKICPHRQQSSGSGMGGRPSYFNAPTTPANRTAPHPAGSPGAASPSNQAVCAPDFSDTSPSLITVLIKDGQTDIIRERKTLDDVFASRQVPARLANKG